MGMGMDMDTSGCSSTLCTMPMYPDTVSAAAPRTSSSILSLHSQSLVTRNVR